MNKGFNFEFIFLSFLLLFFSFGNFTLAAELPSPPTIVSPADGATNVSIPAVLDWTDVPEAKGYYLQFFRDENDDGAITGEEIFNVGGIGSTDGAPTSTASYDLEMFTKSTLYGWEVATCVDTSCGEFSTTSTFTTTANITIDPPTLLSPFYDPTKPDEIPAVNLSDSLMWQPARGARAYQYEIREGATIATSSLVAASSVSFEKLWSYLNLDITYSWQVKSCWAREESKCETIWSTEWKFKTTGAPPNLLNADATIIPVKLNWEDVPGALSYKYEVIDISTNEKVATGTVSLAVGIPPSEILVDYPNLKQEKTYSWKVRTCADREGEDPFCGTWSNSQEFTTFKLGTPSNPTPEDGGQLFTYDKYISWHTVPGARAYQYTIDYIELSSEEKNEKCPGLVGTKIIPPTITTSPSVFLTLECLGKYHWSVRACLDKDCQETGDWSGPWLFNFVQPTPVGKAGLVPCGRTIDYPETPWNEREPCQFKHIFILLKNIIDLLLWRIGLMILVLLVIATGVVYYFSMGAPTTMAKVKSILKSAGMGYAIIFLAWIIINLILSILGYKIGIFGKWWQIKF